MAAITDTLVTVLEVQGLSSWQGAFSQMGGTLQGLDTKVGRFQAGAALSAATAGLIAAGLGHAVNAASKLQGIRTGLTSALGSPQAAEKMMSDLRNLAARTPFGFEQAASGAQKLLGAGLDQNRIIPLQEALGKILLVNGKNAGDFGEAMQQISQTIGSGKLQGDELRVLSERGLPRAELEKLLQGKKDAASFVDAVIKLGQSGKYANAFTDASNNLSIAWSNLQDEANTLSASIGTGLLPPLTTMTKWIASALGWFNKLPDAVKGAAGWVGVGMVAALVGVSFWLTRAAFLTAKLAAENVNLANSYYKAAGAAQLAGPKIGGAAGGAAAGGGFWGAAKGFGGKALGFLSKWGLPLMLAGEAGQGLMEGNQSGDWGGAFQRFLWGDKIGGPLKQGGGGVGSGVGGGMGALLEEAKKQTEIQKQQLDATKAMSDTGSLPTDFIPLGIQRSMTKKFARAAR